MSERARKRRRRLSGLLLVVVLPLLVAARCTSQEVKDLMGASRQLIDQPASDVGAESQLVAAQSRSVSLKSVRGDDIADADAAALPGLKQGLDARTAHLADLVAEAAAQKGTALVTTSASTVAVAATARSAKSEFLTDLKTITEEAIKGQACDIVRQAAFPAGNPSEPVGDESGWQGAATSLANAARLQLVKKWAPTGVATLVEWVEWGDEVVKAGRAVYQTQVSDPNRMVVYTLRPDLRQAAVQYAKFCHSPPKK